MVKTIFLGMIAAIVISSLIRVESRDYPQSQGFYASGSLVNPDQQALESIDTLKLFQFRNRGFATLDLTTLIESAAHALRSEFPESERIQMGDTSQETGGKISGHDSHQNGLDIDLVYLRRDHREMDPMATDGFDETFVDPGKVTSNFDVARNFRFIALLQSSGRLQRVFMDPVIKHAMCDYASAQGIREPSMEVLRAMRPWPHHDDHMHVRITCPPASTHCVAQEPPPLGDGCDVIDLTEAQNDEIGC